MSDLAENEGSLDFSKMKVNDLRKILKSRGLSVTGVKQDLIERLQSSEAAAEALLEDCEVGEDGFDEELDKELDETALMADEEHPDELPSGDTGKKTELNENVEKIKNNEKSEIPTSPKKEDSKESLDNILKQNGSTLDESESAKQGKLSLKSQPLPLSEAEKKKARAERFGTSEKNAASALAKRAQRFSLNKDSTSKAADSSTGQTKVTSTTNELLKRRAERFGILSPVEVKRQHLEKLQARKMRFQQSTSPSASMGPMVATSTSSSPAASSTTTATTTTNGTKVATSLTVDERKRLRAERFKTTT